MVVVNVGYSVNTMKTSYEFVSYANLFHNPDNVRNEYEFPDMEELAGIGRSIDANGIKNLPEQLICQPGEELGRAKGTFQVWSGNVKLAAVGTLPAAKLADAMLPCRIITGMDREKWEILAINANIHFPVSNWGVGRRVLELDKAGMKAAAIKVKLNKAASEVTNLKCLGLALEYSEDHAGHLAQAAKDGRLAPTAYLARLNEFNSTESKKAQGVARVCWNEFVDEMERFIFANPGIQLTEAVFKGDKGDKAKIGKAFAAFKYAATITTPVEGATTPVTTPVEGAPATPPTASINGLPSPQAPIGSQAGNQAPVKLANETGEGHGDSWKGRVTTLCQSIQNTIHGKASDTAKLQFILIAVGKFVGKEDLY